MNKLVYLVVAVAAICLVSSGAAIFLGSGNIDVNQASIATANDNIGENIAQNIDKNINEKIMESISEDNSVDSANSNEFIPGTKAFIPGILNYDKIHPEFPAIYILDRPVSKLFLSYGMDYTDRYGFCQDCQGYIILGPITKTLPENTRYCDGYCEMQAHLSESNTYSYNNIMGIEEESQSLNEPIPLYRSTNLIPIKLSDSVNNTDF